jgi:dipeptidyl aminopeptidase/acylaminoacyl peptidase
VGKGRILCSRFERGAEACLGILTELFRQSMEVVLLIQGDDDRNVPFSQTVDLAQRLRDNHVPFEQIVYPDEIHDFLLWKDFIRSYEATAQFFQKHLTNSE